MPTTAGIDGGSSTIKAVLIRDGQSVEIVATSPAGSQPLRTACNLLQEIR